MKDINTIGHNLSMHCLEQLKENIKPNMDNEVYFLLLMDSYRTYNSAALDIDSFDLAPEIYEYTNNIANKITVVNSSLMQSTAVPTLFLIDEFGRYISTNDNKLILV